MFWATPQAAPRALSRGRLVGAAGEGPRKAQGVRHGWSLQELRPLKDRVTGVSAAPPASESLGRAARGFSGPHSATGAKSNGSPGDRARWTTSNNTCPQDVAPGVGESQEAEGAEVASLTHRSARSHHFPEKSTLHFPTQDVIRSG